METTNVGENKILYLSPQEDVELTSKVLEKLEERFPAAAANWLGGALREMLDPATYPKMQVYKSYMLSTAVMLMDSQDSTLISAFIRDPDLLKLAQHGQNQLENRKNIEQLMAATAIVVTKYANESWRLGKSGRRLSHFLGLLRIYKAMTGNRLRQVPLHLAAALAMTTCSGVQWEPPRVQRPSFKLGISPALADHITSMARESTMHYRYKDYNFHRMDKEYERRALRLLELACEWGEGVPEGEPRYLELTKFHLLAPILNPLMRLNYDSRLKRLYKKARPETPLDILPAYYPFNDLSSSSSSEEGEEEVAGSRGEVPKRRRGGEARYTPQIHGPPAAAIEEEAAAERRREEEEEHLFLREREREVAAAEHLLQKEREREVAAAATAAAATEKKRKEEERKRLEQRLMMEKKAAAAKEREEAAAALVRKREEELFEEARRMRVERRAEEEKSRRAEGAAKEKDGGRRYTGASVFRGAKRVRFRRPSCPSEWREEEYNSRGRSSPVLNAPRTTSRRQGPASDAGATGKVEKFPIAALEETMPQPWSFSRIREAQKGDSQNCQFMPSECQGFYFRHSTKRFEACRRKHPWGPMGGSTGTE